MYDEITKLDYKEKNNDLYLFSQSERDLKSVRLELITKFREVLYSEEVKNAISKISGIELYGLEHTSQPDIFAAVYSDTSRLLCHDDELEGRRIAYILYLVPEDWSEEDGGHLDLFASDAITKLPIQENSVSLLPRRAAFAFFEVSPQSFHQVREVLTSTKLRVSIGGWFHGPPITRPHQANEPCVPCLPPVPMLPPSSQPPTTNSTLVIPVDECVTQTDDLLAKITPSSFQSTIEYWVQKSYFKPATIKQIVKSFGNDSSIELNSFLRPERYEAIVKALAAREEKAFANVADDAPAVAVPPAEDSDFLFRGPVNLRCYYQGKDSLFISKPDDDSDILAKFGAFICSPEFFKLMNLYTTCDFQGASTELRLLRKGCYTLAHDLDNEIEMEGLDVYFTAFDTKKAKTWNDEHGGSSHYLQAGEDEELLTSFPVANTLSLVYRSAPSRELQEDGTFASEGGVLTFTRYIDHHAPCSIYQYKSIFRLKEEVELSAEEIRAAEAAAKAAAAKAKATKKQKSANKYK